MRFRPCIDLHGGKVKQIVGSTLKDANPDELVENFVSGHSPSYFAALFKKDGLTGGHVIMLGPGNEDAAREALDTWPGGLQIGGGITADNASYWLDQGAAAVIVTSYVFKDGLIKMDRLRKLQDVVGRKRLVLDLSCKKKDGSYFIVTDRWQRFTNVKIEVQTLDELSQYCSEFLIHAAHVEGKCQGVDIELVKLLADWTPIPTTYAGGARSMDDVRAVKKAGRDRIDLTVGSALDIFGGHGIAYEELVRFTSADEKKN